MPTTSLPSATPPDPAPGALPLDRAVARDLLPDAVVFDLDGTLIDSVDDVTATLNALLGEEGIATFSDRQVRLMMGDGVHALICKALDARGVEEPPESELERLKDRFLELYCTDPVVATTAFPHAAELLAALAGSGIALGICTNKAEQPARLILQRLGLDAHLGVLIAADSGFGQKPDPGPLLACATKLGVPRDRIVYVGDHPVDIETARAARVPVVAVAFGYSAVPAQNFGADRTVTCLSELPAALAGLVR
jgi:phosphoglycolate phosphatase